MKSLTLRADYFYYPIWLVEGDGLLDNKDPATPPTSETLATDLLAWADAFDAVLDQDDPANSGFKTELQREKFVSQESELAQRLTIEPGPIDFTVTYRRSF
jgi:hypothetical protein